MFSVGRSSYGPIFVVAVPLIAIIAAATNPNVFLIALAVFAVVAVVLPLIYCSLPGLGFAEALGALSAPYCSGCANLTILYIWIVILPSFCYGFWLSLIGIRQGRDKSRELWHAYLHKRLA